MEIATPPSMVALIRLMTSVIVGAGCLEGERAAGELTHQLRRYEAAARKRIGFGGEHRVSHIVDQGPDDAALALDIDDRGGDDLGGGAHQSAPTTVTVRSVLTPPPE